MFILGIESSSVTASAALVKDNVLVAEFTMNYKKTHSQTLLPVIDEIVKMTQTKLEDLDAIAVSAGPGSFTGLRIGSATAKGLGLALKKPVAEISTIDAMAYGCFGFYGIVCPIEDARRNQVYTGIYRFDKNGNLITLKEPFISDINELLQLLAEYEETVMFTGDGIAAYQNIIQEKLKNSIMAPVMQNCPRAASVAALGEIYYKEGRVVAAADHRPVYLRKSQAERQREAGIYTKGSIRPEDVQASKGL